VLVYIPLYFWAKGRLEVDEERWYNFHITVPDLVEDEDEDARRKTALKMLFYPIAYSIVVLPLSIARWMQFNHYEVPSAATFFGHSVFHLSGVINVLLLLIARPQLLLFSRPVANE